MSTVAEVAAERSRPAPASGQDLSILHLTPHDELCGIAKYQERSLRALADLPGLRNTVFRWSPYQTRDMDRRAFTAVLAELRAALVDHDILHLQHEFELYPADQFAQIARVVLTAKKRLVVTVHTSPGTRYRPLKLNKLGPRSLITLARDHRERRRFMRQHGRAFRMADALIVHNPSIADGLRRLGAAPSRIHLLPHPVPTVSHDRVSTAIRDRLGARPGDTVVAMVGFIHRSKGIQDAIQALSLLPSTYKLAIIGGMHPLSHDHGFLDELTDLVSRLDLAHRVCITGSVEDDKAMNALIRECDVCVFPYDRVYYAQASSDSLSLALANHVPVIAYPTDAFVAVGRATDALILCTDFSSEALARELLKVDLSTQRERAATYASAMSWSARAMDLANLLLTLAPGVSART